MNGIKVTPEFLKASHFADPDSDGTLTYEEFKGQLPESLSEETIASAFSSYVQFAQTDPESGEAILTELSCQRRMYALTGEGTLRLKVSAFVNSAKSFAQNFIPATLNLFKESAEFGHEKTAFLPDSPIKGLSGLFWATTAFVGMSCDGFAEGAQTAYALESRYFKTGDPEAAGRAAFLIPILALMAFTTAKGMTKAPFNVEPIRIPTDFTPMPATTGAYAAASAPAAAISVDAGAIAGLGLSSPMMASTTDGDASAPAAKTKRGAKPKYSDDELAAVLEKHKGNRRQAAKELEMANPPIVMRIKRASKTSPLAKFGKLKGKGGNPLKHSDDDLAAVLERHQGNRTKTAKELGMHSNSIRYRIQKASKKSLLAKFKKLKGKSGGNVPRHTNPELAEVLEKHQGNRTKTAEELGMDISAICRRIHRASKTSPLAKFKELKGKAGRPLKHSDAELAAALDKHKGNPKKAAAELWMLPGSIISRIEKTPATSSLAKFKKQHP